MIGSELPPHVRRILSRPEVDVWRVALDVAPDELQGLLAMLSPDEVARAERFVRPRDTDHFIVARGSLRCVLAGYLEVRPDEVAFRYGERGKPVLADEFDESGIRFNLSHSHGLALLAVTRRREVGIDIELIERKIEHEQIATRFFSEAECAELLALPPAQRSEGFFRCWTRKEAYIKALGEGLSHPLADFDVTLVPGAPARLLATRRDPAEARRWEMLDLTPQPGYAAALVIQVEAGFPSAALSR